METRESKATSTTSAMNAMILGIFPGNLFSILFTQSIESQRSANIDLYPIRNPLIAKNLLQFQYRKLL